MAAIFDGRQRLKNSINIEAGGPEFDNFDPLILQDGCWTSINVYPWTLKTTVTILHPLDESLQYFIAVSEPHGQTVSRSFMFCKIPAL